MLFCFFLVKGYGQVNIVHNPSFEDTIQCPVGINEIYNANFWFQPCVYYGNVINSSSSDLFNTCGWAPQNNVGFQNPRTGSGYAGIFVYEDTINGREYIENSLLSPLIQGKVYCVEFYVSLADSISSLAITNMGAFFSNDSLLVTSYYALSSITPQVENLNTNYLSSKTNWMRISGTFVAAGGERFITLGNFHNVGTTNTQSVSGGWVGVSYYYIDDVSVIDCDSIAGVEEMEKGEISISPNPATNEFTIKNAGLRMNAIHIYNVLGEEVLKLERIANSEKVIDVSEWKAGVYFVEVETEKGIVRRKVIKSTKY